MLTIFGHCDYTWPRFNAFHNIRSNDAPLLQRNLTVFYRFHQTFALTHVHFSLFDFFLFQPFESSDCSVIEILLPISKKFFLKIFLASTFVSPYLIFFNASFLVFFRWMLLENFLSSLDWINIISLRQETRVPTQDNYQN